MTTDATAAPNAATPTASTGIARRVGSVVALVFWVGLTYVRYQNQFVAPRLGIGHHIEWPMVLGALALGVWVAYEFGVRLRVKRP